MFTKLSSLIVGALALLISSAAMAEDKNKIVVFPKWTINAELGSIWTTGNTETSSLNAKFDMKRQGRLWTWQFKASALGSKEDSVTSKEKYDGSFKIDRSFSEHMYLTVMTQQERDRFSGFRYQSTTSSGLGYRLIQSDSMNLEVEAGPGYYREHLRNPKEEASIKDELIGRFAFKYSWTLREGVIFTEEFSMDRGELNQIYRSETGLKTQINGSLATKLTYKIKHTENVPVDSERTDGEFGVTLVYSFK